MKMTALRISCALLYHNRIEKFSFTPFKKFLIRVTILYPFIIVNKVFCIPIRALQKFINAATDRSCILKIHLDPFLLQFAAAKNQRDLPALAGREPSGMLPIHFSRYQCVQRLC